MPLARVKDLLTASFSPTHLTVEDESRLHSNHHFAGHDGGSHFIATIVSTNFEGLSLLERHKAVYEVLGEYISSGEIHALGLKTYTDAEWQKRK